MIAMHTLYNLLVLARQVSLRQNVNSLGHAINASDKWALSMQKANAENTNTKC
ncbi:hypothetical protein [Helicobacter sp. 12S02634-8]|uniref:hypothetical protein n=1 Tax=Helicobacter sp. 12S02634-8 TaxID=1476199 RepID=UPI00155642DE|nr:hypothetical protein [Helicobacter sp. 12S02634-8]